MNTDIVEIIKQFTDYIRSRRKGREVRASIADAIDKIAEEAATAIGTLNGEFQYAGWLTPASGETTVDLNRLDPNRIWAVDFSRKTGDPPTSVFNPAPDAELGASILLCYGDSNMRYQAIIGLRGRNWTRRYLQSSNTWSVWSNGVDSTLTADGLAADAGAVRDRFAAVNTLFGDTAYFRGDFDGDLNGITHNGWWLLQPENQQHYYSHLPPDAPTNVLRFLLRIGGTGNSSALQLFFAPGSKIYMRRYLYRDNAWVWGEWTGGLDDSLSLATSPAQAKAVGDRFKETAYFRGEFVGDLNTLNANGWWRLPPENPSDPSTQSTGLPNDDELKTTLRFLLQIGANGDTSGIQLLFCPGSKIYMRRYLYRDNAWVWGEWTGGLDDSLSLATSPAQAKAVGDRFAAQEASVSGRFTALGERLDAGLLAAKIDSQAAVSEAKSASVAAAAATGRVAVLEAAQKQDSTQFTSVKKAIEQLKLEVAAIQEALEPGVGGSLFAGIIKRIDGVEEASDTGDNALWDEIREIRHDIEELIVQHETSIIEFSDGQLSTERIERAYPTLIAAIQDDKLQVGATFTTAGRYYVNDGGGRTYRVMRFDDVPDYIFNDSGEPRNVLAVPLFAGGDFSSATGDAEWNAAQQADDWSSMHFGRWRFPVPAGRASDLFPVGTCWALPVINDEVTLFDMGCRRGRLRTADVILHKDPTTVMFENGSIPAENSRLFQRYIDAVPRMGTDMTSENDTAAKLDIYATKGAFSRVFVPAGTWCFRDPVVIHVPLKIRGTLTSAAVRHNINSKTRDTPVSMLYYPAREIGVANGNGDGDADRISVGYAPAASDTQFYLYARSNDLNNPDIPAERKAGEKPIDTDAGIMPTVYARQALFFLCARGISFRDLEIATANAFTFGEKTALIGTADTPNTGRIGGRAGGFRPGDDDHNPAVIGKKFNIYYTVKNRRGISGVICGKPVRDGEGRIAIKENGAIQIEANVVHGIEQSLTDLAEFERCRFTGFSEIAVDMGSLTRLNGCRFYGNYIAIQSDGHDCFVHRCYCDSGFIGIVTNSHTTYVSNCYLNMMEGFGVVASIKIRKRTEEWENTRLGIVDSVPTGKDAGNTVKYWITDRVDLTGTLNGKFDADALACVMGAYGFNRVIENVIIQGRIGQCGRLYDMEHTIVSDQNDFVTRLNYNQAKDAVDGDRNEASAWDAVNESWTKIAEAGDQTLGDYNTSVDGIKYKELYRRHKAAHIQLLPTTAYYYRHRFPDDISDDDRGEAIIPAEELEDLIFDKLEEWRLSGDLPYEMANPEGSDGTYTIDDYGDDNRAAALAAVLQELDDSETTASISQSTNRGALIGASAISGGICNGLNILTALFPRKSEAFQYAKELENSEILHVQRAHFYPLYGLSCRSIYNSVISFGSQNSRSTLGNDPLLFEGISTDERLKRNRMRPIISQGNNYATVISAAPPFSETSTGFYSLRSASGTTDAAKYYRFFVQTKQTASGNVSIYVQGYVCTVAGATQVSTTPMPSTAEGAANLQKPLPDIGYAPHYTGFKQTLFCSPLIAFSDYTPSGGVPVYKGETIGSLILDFDEKTITVRGTATYKGRIASISLGGAM